ncbi:hypothetical protein IWX90DRAFT_293312 [Phyllosticta citrichinensis]|uniref:Uncharacterized protein n=1 Tax=Phyllosticta citrichinensis TaxID=1130410 RepID=A0ABR1XKE3_9PEZI
MPGRRERPGRTDPEVDSRVRHETDQRGRGKMATVGVTALSRGCGPAVVGLQRAERPANVRNATDDGPARVGSCRSRVVAGGVRWEGEGKADAVGGSMGWSDIRHGIAVRYASGKPKTVGRKPTRTELGARRERNGGRSGQPTSAETLSFVPAGFSSPCSILCGQLFWVFWVFAEARRTRCRCSRWRTTDSAASWTFSASSSSHHLCPPPFVFAGLCSTLG